MTTFAAPTPPESTLPPRDPQSAREVALVPTRWRLTHMGRLLGDALRRFDARVLQLMAAQGDTPLALANLARREQISAAHIHITRHLPPQGARLGVLASSAGMSKQAMAQLVATCEAWGLVTRSPDALDARAVTVSFTATGLDWLEAFRVATLQAQNEFEAEVGEQVATVVALGLEAYASGLDWRPKGKRR